MPFARTAAPSGRGHGTRCREPAGAGFGGWAIRLQRIGAALALAVGAALLAWTLAACDFGRNGQTLKIGVMLVNSEIYSETSADRLRAFELAVKHVNAGGGVFGRPVEYAEGDVRHAEAEARRLIEKEGVHVIVGPNSSANSLVVVDIAAPAGVLVVSPSASSPALTLNEDRDLFFRNALSDVAQGPALAQLTRERGFDNVAVIYRDDAWGNGLADNFRQAWTGTIASVASPTELRESYLDLLEQSARGGAQALVLITFWPEAEVILNEALASGIYDQFVFGDALRRSELAAAVGAGGLAGMHGTASVPLRDSPSALAWGAAFRDEYGEGTESSFVMETYDGAVAVMLAAEAAGSTDGIAVRDRLRDIGSAPGEQVIPGAPGIARALAVVRDGGDVDYEGAANPVDWDANGDLERGYIGIWRFTATGEIEEVGIAPYGD